MSRHVEGPSTLVQHAVAWVEPYWNARHLRRTLDWLLVLDPEPSEALVLAAVTHDMERHFPGGPKLEPATMAPDDPGYRQAHSERSASIVGGWLRGQGADEALACEVERLVISHEIGGDDDETLLQAADSLSFLHVNAELVANWFRQGRCDRNRAKEQLAYMLDRIRIDRARELARPLYAEGLEVVDGA